MTLAKQVAWSTIGNFLQLFAQWCISIVLVRISGFETAGVFTLALTIANVFAFLSSYSTRHYMTSDVMHEYSRDQYIKTRFYTTILSFFLLLAFLVFYRFDRLNTLAIIAYAVYANSIMISDIFFGSYQLGDHLEYAGYSSIAKGILCFLSFFFVMILFENIIAALWVMALSSFSILLFYEIPVYHRLFGRIEYPRRADALVFLNLVKVCFPLMLSVFIPSLVIAIPRMIIQEKFGELLLGVFGSIFTPTVVITTLVPSIITALVPMYANLWARRDHKRFHLRVFELIGGTIILGCFACVVAVLVGKPVMVLLFGGSIIEYYKLLYSAIIATTLCAIASCYTILLTVVRKLKISLFSALICLVCDAVLAAILIDKFGIFGAAYTLIIAYSVQIIIQSITLISVTTKGKI